MSLYSEPYPKQGIFECPTVFEAQRIIYAAICIDGTEVLQHVPELARHLEKMDTRKGVEFFLGTKIAKVRRPVGKLWEVMSTEAKRSYLYCQWSDAVGYLNSCYANLATLSR